MHTQTVRKRLSNLLSYGSHKAIEFFSNAFQLYTRSQNARDFLLLSCLNIQQLNLDLAAYTMHFSISFSLFFRIFFNKRLYVSLLNIAIAMKVFPLINIVCNE